MQPFQLYLKELANLCFHQRPILRTNKGHCVRRSSRGALKNICLRCLDSSTTKYIHTKYTSSALHVCSSSNMY